MSEIRKQGFYVGYHEFELNKHPLPPAPYPLHTREREAWIRGWGLGRRLAMQHYIEMEERAKEM